MHDDWPIQLKNGGRAGVFCLGAFSDIIDERMLRMDHHHREHIYTRKYIKSKVFVQLYHLKQLLWKS